MKKSIKMEAPKVKEVVDHDFANFLMTRESEEYQVVPQHRINGLIDYITYN